MWRRLAVVLVALSAIFATCAFWPEPSAPASSVTGSKLGAAPASSYRTSTWRFHGWCPLGQSTCTGFSAGGGCLSYAQPFNNQSVRDSDGGYYFIDGGPFLGTNLSLVPLTCLTIRNNAPSNGLAEYPANLNGSDSESADFATNQITRLALDGGFGRYDFISTNTAINGQRISALIKGAATYNAYEAMVGDAQAACLQTAVAITAVTLGNPTILTAAGHGLLTGNHVNIVGLGGTTEANGYWTATALDANRLSVPVNSTHAFTGGTLTPCPTGAASPCAYLTSYGVEWLNWEHGQSDAQFALPSASYVTSLAGIVTNLQADVSAFTGQPDQIKVVATQQNSSTTLGLIAPHSNTTGDAILGLVGASGYYISGPTYQLNGPGNSGPHFDTYGYFHKDDKTAEAVNSVRMTGNWLPLYPTSKAVVDSTHVNVNFGVPVRPLQWNVALPLPHQSGTLSNVWSNGKGFEAVDVTTLVITNTTGNGVSPIVVTIGAGGIGAAGLVTGNYVAVGGNGGFVGGNSAAGEAHQVTVLSDTQYQLTGVTGNGNFSGLFQSPSLMILLPITSVAICTGAGVPVAPCTAPDQVGIVLGRAPVTSLSIGYADTPDTGGFQAGVSLGGSSGNLEDSDPYCGAPLFDGGAPFCDPNHALAFHL